MFVRTSLLKPTVDFLAQLDWLDRLTSLPFCCFTSSRNMTAMRAVGRVCGRVTGEDRTRHVVFSFFFLCVCIFRVACVPKCCLFLWPMFNYL